MSFQAMAWAVQQQPADSKHKFILLMLANYASNEQGECYPSLSELCDATMLSKDSVIRGLKALEEGGFIIVERRRQGNVNLPNTYKLQLAGTGTPQRVVVAAGDYPSRSQQGGVVAGSDPNLSVEPISSANARENELDTVTDKLFKAAGFDDFRSEKSPQLLSIGPILNLMAQGYDLDRSILPVVAEVARRKRIRTWAYIVPVVIEREQQRKAIPAKPPPANEDWAGRMRVFAEGTWAVSWGPKPGEPGCKVPKELMEKAA
jgi:DNA-binding transcriptional ArsR family regulator